MIRIERLARACNADPAHLDALIRQIAAQCGTSYAEVLSACEQLKREPPLTGDEFTRLCSAVYP